MNRDLIKDQLIKIIAVVLEIKPTMIDPALSFDAMGLDSMAKVSIVPELERQFGCQFNSEVLFDCADLTALASHIELVLNAKQ